MRSPRNATKSSPRSLQLEKACTQQRRPNAAKKKETLLVPASSLEGRRSAEGQLCRATGAGEELEPAQWGHHPQGC